MKKSINRLLACFLAILLVFLNIPIAFVVNATGSRPIGADTQTNAANQKWAFIPVVKDSATWYKIKGVSTGLVLTIEGTSSGSYVKESADLGSDDTQLWEVTIVAGNLWSWGFYGNAIKPKLADQGTTWPTFLTCSDAGVLTISTAGWGDNIEQSFQLNGSCINIWDVAPNNAPNPGVAYTISRKNWGPVDNYKTLESTASAINYSNIETVSSLTSSGALNQKWFFSPVSVSGTTYYKISSAYTGKYLTATFAVGQTYMAVTTTDEINNCDFQLWEITPGGGTWTDYTCIVNKAIPVTLVTDGVYQPEPHRLENAVVRLLATGSQGGNAFFQFNGNSLLDPVNPSIGRTPIPGTAYEIKTNWYDLTTLTANGNPKAAVTTNDAEMAVRNNLLNQQWYFEQITKDGGTYYKIKNAFSNKYLTGQYVNNTLTKVVEQVETDTGAATSDYQLWSINGGAGGIIPYNVICIVNKGFAHNLDYRNANISLTRNWSAQLEGAFLLSGVNNLNPSPNTPYVIHQPVYSNPVVLGYALQSPVPSNVTAVINQINALNIDNITSSDAAAVNSANSSYSALSENEKSIVSNYNKLVKATAALSSKNAYTKIDAGETRIVCNGSDPLFGYVPNLNGKNYGIGYSTVGDYISIPNVDFGTVGAKTVTIEATTPTAGQQYGLYLDGNFNNLIATFTMPISNNTDLDLPFAQTVTESIANANITGIHSVQIKWISAAASFFSVSFEEKPLATFDYNVSLSNVLTDVPLQTTLLEFKNGIHLVSGASYRIMKNSQEITSDSALIGTGIKVEVSYPDRLAINYTVMIKGDVDGTGEIQVGDLASVKQHLLKNNTLYDVYFQAADLNSDLKVSISDLISIKKTILGIAN